MNQAILFNDDLQFDQQQNAWWVTALLAGHNIAIYFHSCELNSLATIEQSTKFDLEDVAERWLEHNELEGNEIHITME